MTAGIDWRTSALDLDLRGLNGERYVGDKVPDRQGVAGRYLPRNAATRV
jgi:hypothetical protein